MAFFLVSMLMPQGVPEHDVHNPLNPLNPLNAREVAVRGHANNQSNEAVAPSRKRRSGFPLGSREFENLKNEALRFTHPDGTERQTQTANDNTDGRLRKKPRKKYGEL